jgi:hypothetical protein
MGKYALAVTLNFLPKCGPNSRVHWSVRYKENERIEHEMHVLTLNQRPPVPLKRAKLSFTRGSSTPMDADGLVSSFKGVQDSLVKCKIIKDDKWINIGMPDYYWQKTPPKKGFVKVIVEELP